MRCGESNFLNTRCSAGERRARNLVWYVIGMYCSALVCESITVAQIQLYAFVSHIEHIKKKTAHRLLWGGLRWTKNLGGFSLVARCGEPFGDRLRRAAIGNQRLADLLFTQLVAEEIQDLFLHASHENFVLVHDDSVGLALIEWNEILAVEMDGADSGIDHRAILPIAHLKVIHLP